MKLFLTLVLFSCVALAQDDAAMAQAKAACGSDEVHFDLKTSNIAHSIAEPESGKALIYVIGEDITGGIFCKGCGILARVGLNGDWVGAINGNSSLSFSVAPGEHHMCANWQSKFASRSKRLSLASLNAEAGKVYYFRMRLITQGEHYPPILDLDPINSDEGKYMVLAAQVSESHIKK